MFKISENNNFSTLAKIFDGELFFDESTQHEALRVVYSTDASAYQEKPLAVAIPKTVEDIKKNVSKAVKSKILGEPIITDISCTLYLDGFMDKDKKTYIPQDGKIFKILPSSGTFYVRYNISSTSVLKKSQGTVREDQITLDQLCIIDECEGQTGGHRGGIRGGSFEGKEGIDFMRICE